MERRFDMSDFEQSLKDHADQFKMIPSKRVWNGIYNNLHPGSKWPSITVAIIFIITLVTIGSLDNSSSHLKVLANTDLNRTKNISGIKNENLPGNQVSDQTKRRINSSKSDLSNSLKGTIEEEFNPQDTNASISHSVTTSISSEKNSGQTVAHRHSPANGISRNNIVRNLQSKSTFRSNKAAINQPAYSITETQSDAISNLSTLDVQKEQFQVSAIRKPELSQNNFSIPVSYKIYSLPDEWLYLDVMSFNAIEQMASNSVVLNQNTSLSAKKLHKKKNSKIEWTFYINPTVSTVSLFNKKTVEPSITPSSIVVLPNQPSFKLIRKKRIGMETGAEMSLKFSRKFKFITGFNLNYLGYTNVSNFVHPAPTTLTLYDNEGRSYEKSYITHYGNGQSQAHISLPNYNLEASIPVGLQYNIWGNNKVKIDIASLLEPSVLLKNDAYMISSDGRYYINDPSLVRRTNLEANFGTYITLIGKKIKWHLGPDVRYQLLSTYKNIYPSKEHLIDYGIRIGISK